ncbi:MULTISPECIES: putative O-glycosylation ligase, exosortase A system-associated [unclassified Colwellia]|uniref:putative O-glycosylation ligase, exosortase A system-associated n=1 Tax=unclassified Colwellia TaxID=196834 RepID=UPI0015F40BE9|nr:MULTISPECIES: putative O-glycosylation ligase, exosortase A system-associated [unclassified Colwellia]MBA6377933.1 putative O-glycosylation ligase, exosortase A system-associated [Colwellia sp. BRX10-7]MBA6387601.1 putative O-glycosylation ligase, exosortase A system-associated [Colwellia sp. BRX10-2]MBA6400941.1 putative O-glycosylation ligase, exosortase A system-associated [Colwellia sp. BRX10-5]MBA6404785.1 putative O-glycosylation ligase, exosortase A system-associated [Colwellia sp. BR
MLSDILWIIILFTFSFLGLKRPYIAYCCVIFVDILKPQNLSFSILANKPLSLIVTIVFFLSLMMNHKKCSFPNYKTISLLILAFMVWITITTFYAEFQFLAWYKYDYSIKTIFFAIFAPFVINSKVKFQLFLMTIVTAASYYFIIGGMTTVFEPTFYGEALIRTNSGDTLMTESSTLSMTAVMLIPILYYLYKHSIFVEKNKLFKPTLMLILFASLMTIVGTHARTGIIGLAILFILVALTTKYKVRIMVLCAGIILMVQIFATDAWLERIGTITTSKQESSAYGRIVVWKWTIDYVQYRPILGGGFMSYKANAGVLHLYGKDGVSVDYREQSGKAFHNIYFEVLGEHGYPGLVIFSLIIFLSLKLNRKISKTSNEPWIRDAAIANNICLLIYCGCGMFIGIAFSPWLYLFSGLAVSLDNCQRPKTKTSPSKKSIK